MSEDAEAESSSREREQIYLIENGRNRHTEEAISNFRVSHR